MNENKATFHSVLNFMTSRCKNYVYVITIIIINHDSHEVPGQIKFNILSGYMLLCHVLLIKLNYLEW